MPPIGFAEIVLITRTMDASVRFYRDVLGLRPEKEPTEEWAWFRLDDGTEGRPQRLALRDGTLLYQEESPRHDLPEADRLAGPMHFALHVEPNDLSAALNRLREHGVPLHGPVELEWMQASGWYCYDPSGNLVELWTPREA